MGGPGPMLSRRPGGPSRRSAGTASTRSRRSARTASTSSLTALMLSTSYSLVAGQGEGPMPPLVAAVGQEDSYSGPHG